MFSSGVLKKSDNLNIKHKYAFSMLEIIVSLIVVMLIAGAFIPVLSKKLKKGIVIAGTKINLSTECCGNEDCKLCNRIANDSDMTCECIDCQKTCESNQFLDRTKCECFNCNDTENGGIEHCFTCEKNLLSQRFSCSECMPGYTLNNTTGQCDRTMSVAQVGTIAWSARNAGESDGPAFEWGDGTNGTVVRCEVGQSCSGGGTTPTCWQGATAVSNTCTDSDGYSGCNRTVCNWYAANLICANAEMSLPTNAQFYDLRGGSASTAAYNQPSVKFCNENSSLASTYSRCNYVANCTGSNGSHCGPDSVWGVENGSSNGHSYYLKSGNLYGSISQNKGIAYSVRCTKDCSLIEHCTACGASGCTECESGYYPNNGECLPCAAHCARCTSSSCTECESGYYLNNGECLPCGEHCARCNSTQCLECDGGGYQVEGFNCVRPPIATTTINGYAWTTVNAGDTEHGGLSIPNGVTICDAGSNTCTIANTSNSNLTPVCWVGTTAGTNTTYNDYPGLSRTVCNWTAANLICTSHGMELPTKTQFEYLRSSGTTFNPDYAALNLCGTASGSYYAQCAQAQNCKNACTGDVGCSCAIGGGRSSQHYCWPAVYWTQTARSSALMWAFMLENSNLNTTIYLEWVENGSLSACRQNTNGSRIQDAFSVRCVKSCNTYDPRCLECNASRCTRCMNGYQTTPSGGCEEIPELYTTTINGVTWTTRNAGDTGGPHIPNSVQICYTGSNCTISNTSNNSNLTPVCWVGTTAGTNTTYNDYPGLSRTVCNWTAANLICESIGMALPTKTQFESLRSSGTTFNPDYAALNLCGTASGSYYAQCAQAQNCQNACTGDVGCGCAIGGGRSSQHYCWPAAYWTQTARTSDLMWAFMLENSNLNTTIYLEWVENGSLSACSQNTNGSRIQDAFSVRCVQAN